MKTILITLIICLPVISFGQNCRCDSDTLLKDIISCDTIKFDNNALLYWNFNCDSCWLTFQNAGNNTEILFSMGDGLQQLAGRLGFIYAQEYKNAFLIQNNVISGCCTPPEFYLFNKTTGKEEKSLGRILFYSEDKKLPFIVSLKGSNDTSANVNYDALTVYDVNTKKEYTVGLAKGEIERTLRETNEMYPEYLFQEPVIKGNLLTLTYNVSHSRSNNNKRRTIMINLKTGMIQ